VQKNPTPPQTTTNALPLVVIEWEIIYSLFKIIKTHLRDRMGDVHCEGKKTAKFFFAG
jgi:hypothetical protein